MPVEIPTAVLSAILTRLAGSPLHELRLEARKLRRGLESQGVVALTARFRDASGRQRLIPLVAKPLAGRGVREAAVYESLVSTRAAEAAPRVLGVHLSGGRGVLFLENVRQACAWPWSDTAHAVEVLRCVARLHQTPCSELSLPPWDYEADLARSAAETVEALERARGDAVLDESRRSLPALRRVGRSIDAVRRALLGGPLPLALIHGDLHSGNVVVRRARRTPGAPRVALIDWQRARLGSPFEDLSSFLQSLAFWEPKVRRCHDTLLGEYLAARGLDRRLTREVRDAYWLAGATNAFAGALAYHVAVTASDERSATERARAARSVRDWLRVVRRADAVWGGGAARTGGRAREGPSRG